MICALTYMRFTDLVNRAVGQIVLVVQLQAFPPGRPQVVDKPGCLWNNAATREREASCLGGWCVGQAYHSPIQGAFFVEVRIKKREFSNLDLVVLRTGVIIFVVVSG